MSIDAGAVVTHEATMSSKGQVTVPKQVRDDLELKAGDRVFFVRTDGGYILKAKNLSIMDLRGFLADYPLPSPEQQEHNLREALREKYSL